MTGGTSKLMRVANQFRNDILAGLVKVNGEVEERRGRKLYDGDIFEYDGVQVKVEK